VSFVLVKKHRDASACRTSPRGPCIFICQRCNVHQQRESTPFTPAIQVMYALDEALQELLEEGLHNASCATGQLRSCCGMASNPWG